MSKVEVSGIVKSVVFYNYENGYAVFKVELEENSEFKEKEVTCIGEVVNVMSGEYIEITGEIVTHPTYGNQIKVQSYKKNIPTTPKGLELYLASGVVKGLGAVLSERIVSTFGEDTMYVLTNEPDKLAKIKGITKNKATEISYAFAEQKESREILIKLQEYDISITAGTKIYNYYKNNTLQILQENPYKLSEDIYGIGFKLADAIAQKIGIEKNSIFRIRAGIKHLLSENAIMGGNVYLKENLLINNTINLLEVDDELILKAIGELIIEKQIYAEEIADSRNIFLSYYYYAESYVANKILQLNNNKSAYEKYHDELLKKVELENNMELAVEQVDAVKQAMINGVLVITGGPGTGKTTTINSIIAMFKGMGCSVQLCAPTGKAAKRMSEATGEDAQTIHRMLGFGTSEDKKDIHNFKYNEDFPLEQDVIIVDECSMIDIMLMNSLLRAIAQGTRLILVGDVDQLPSIGAGNVLKDIINSNCVKVIQLKRIFRQAEESLIVTNAHKINQGEYPELNKVDKDFFFIKAHDSEMLGETVATLLSERLPKFAGIDDPKTIQVLAPMRKSPVGIYHLNTVLQDKLNPKSKSKNEKLLKNGVIFREGDKVMQIKNNYQISWTVKGSLETGTGVFNGDEGIIQSIDTENHYIYVLFDDLRIVKYTFSQLDELELSYAITIHKSQGSEYKVVVMVIHSGAPILLTRNLLYTALTRAKEIAVIVGISDTVNGMVRNNSEVNRFTYLSERMKKLSGFV